MSPHLPEWLVGVAFLVALSICGAAFLYLLMHVILFLVPFLP